MSAVTHVSSHVSVLELRYDEQNENWGYTLVTHNGQPARSFNDPSGNDPLAKRRIAHDWQQHGFLQKTNGHIDELIAIGMQEWVIPDFIDERGGLGGFIAEQVFPELADNDFDWSSLKSPYNVVDPIVLSWIKQNRDGFLE